MTEVVADRLDPADVRLGPVVSNLPSRSTRASERGRAARWRGSFPFLERDLLILLATPVTRKQMTPMTGRIAALSVLRPDDFSRHAGERLVFVLDHVLEMHFVDGRVARLAKRDSIYGDRGLDHLYVNGSGGRAGILVVPRRGFGAFRLRPRP